MPKQESAQRKWLRFEGRLLLFFCGLGVAIVYLAELYFGHGQLLPPQLFFSSLFFKFVNNFCSSPWYLSADSSKYQKCRDILAEGEHFFGGNKLDNSIIHYEDFSVPVAALTTGTINLRVYQAANKNSSDARLIYYIHGGGYAIGELAQYSDLFTEFVNQGFVVASPEYRRAPEHKFPTAVEDVVAAFKWLRANLANRYNVNKVIVAGDSAGGALASILPFELRDSQLPQVQYQVLIYPITMVTDDAKKTESYHQFKKVGYFIDARQIDNFDRMYNPEKIRSPRESVILNTDFSGIPPALVVTVENDILRSQGELYAKKLTDNGVTAEVYEVKGEAHIFIQSKVYTVNLEERQKVIKKIVDSIDKYVPAQ